MGTSLRNKIWEQADIDGGKLLVLLAMADFGDDDGQHCAGFMHEISGKARLSMVHARRLIHEMIREGFLTLLVQGGWFYGVNRPNEWRINISRLLPLESTMQDERDYHRNFTRTPTAPPPVNPESTEPHDRDYPSAEHRGYTGERRAPEPPAAHTCIRAENDIYLFNSQDQDLDQEKKINTYSGSAIAIRACEEASPSQVDVSAIGAERDEPDEEDEEFAASVELLTHEDVGLKLSFAQDAAKIYSFKFLVKQVFAWLDGRAKGSKYNTTGALCTRIKREFNAPALTHLQENSRLFKQFCRKDYSGADFVPLKRKQYNIDGELLADTPYEYPIIGGRYQA